MSTYYYIVCEGCGSEAHIISRNAYNAWGISGDLAADFLLEHVKECGCKHIKIISEDDKYPYS